MSFRFARYPVISLAGFLSFGAIQLSADSTSSDTIYLESNSTAGNSIFTYTFNFSSAPVLKSTTPAAGIGVFDPTFALGPFDSDQNLIENSSGTLLFAVNSGSNSIAVFHINPDGSLSPVSGSPFPSGGSDPVSVGLKGDTLVVVNKDQDPAQTGTAAGAVLPNYTSFSVSLDGGLTPVPNSTISVAYGSSPSQALIASQGNVVFGADFLGGLLQSFSLDPKGALDQNLPQALPNSIFTGLAGGHQPLGMRTHPFLPILYVDITPISKVAVYTYDPQGRLNFVRAIPDAGAAPCWAIVNHAGTYLYVTNTGDDSIEVYSLADPLNPKEVQHFVMASNNGGAVFSTVIDHSDEWIYVSSEQSSASAALIAAVAGTYATDSTYGHLILVIARQTNVAEAVVVAHQEAAANIPLKDGGRGFYLVTFRWISENISQHSIPLRELANVCLADAQVGLWPRRLHDTHRVV